MSLSSSLDFCWKMFVFVALSSSFVFGAFMLAQIFLKRVSGKHFRTWAQASVATFLTSFVAIVLLLLTVDQELQRKCFALFAEHSGSYSVTRVVSGLWLFGVVSFLFKDTIQFAHFQRQIRKQALRVEGDVLVMKDGFAPSTFGFIKNIILIPENLLNMPELKYVLAHERMHVERRDGSWNLLGLLALRLAWFNPIAYLFSRSRVLAIEMATDEAVVGRQGFDIRSYCEALVSVHRKSLVKVPALVALGASAEYEQMHERIQNLYRDHSSSRFQLAASVIALLLMWGVGMGQAFASIQTETSQNEEMMCYQVQHEKIFESLFKAPPETNNKCE